MKKSTCVYLIHNHTWLFLYRNRKKNDVNHDKYIGVGGKSLPDETPLECAMREVKEETGLTMIHPSYRGTVCFSYPHLPDEKIWIYTCTEYSGMIHEDNEGTLVWVPEEKIMDLNLWEGDRLFLKKLLKDESRPFCFQFFYDEKDNLIHSEEREDTEL